MSLEASESHIKPEGYFWLHIVFDAVKNVCLSFDDVS